MASEKMLLGFIPRRVSREQARDTGMAMALLCMIIGLAVGNQLFFIIALGVLLIDMAWPKFFIRVCGVGWSFRPVP